MGKQRHEAPVTPRRSLAQLFLRKCLPTLLFDLLNQIVIPLACKSPGTGDPLIHRAKAPRIISD